MAVISYDSKALIPGPTVGWRKEYQTTEDGEIIGSVWAITLRGKFVSHKGSPNKDKSFHTTSGYPADDSLTDPQNFTAILRKQEAVRELFANEGKSLVVQPWDGAAPISFNPRIRGIEFPEGMWYNRCDYIVTMEADVLYISGKAAAEDDANDSVVNYKVAKAAEDWSVEPLDEKKLAFKLTRHVSATGKRFYGTDGALVRDAWLEAKRFVQNKLGLASTATAISNSLVSGVAGKTPFNHVVSESVNKKGGTYSLTESWVLADANSIEEFNIAARTGEDDRTEVSVEGTITGLTSTENTSDKITNAESKYASITGSILGRAQSYTGIALNPDSINKTVTRNVQNGVITYNYTYNDRDTVVIANARSNVITLTYVNANDVFARIPIPGRAAGPILQDVETKTETQLRLSIEAVMKISTKPDTTSLVNSYKPSATQVFKSEDTENWSPTTRRYSRQVAWTYQ